MLRLLGKVGEGGREGRGDSREGPRRCWEQALRLAAAPAPPPPHHPRRRGPTAGAAALSPQ